MKFKAKLLREIPETGIHVRELFKRFSDIPQATVKSALCELVSDCEITVCDNRYRCAPRQKSSGGIR